VVTDDHRFSGMWYVDMIKGHIGVTKCDLIAKNTQFRIKTVFHKLLNKV
jgi:hypothetical protein